MYIRSVHIRNIKSIEQFEMTFPDNPAGWHVVIGDNGVGKTSLLQAITLAMGDERRFLRLGQREELMLNKGKDSGEVIVALSSENQWDQGLVSSKQQNSYRPTLSMTRKEDGIVLSIQDEMSSNGKLPFQNVDPPYAPSDRPNGFLFVGLGVNRSFASGKYQSQEDWGLRLVSSLFDPTISFDFLLDEFAAIKSEEIELRKKYEFPNTQKIVDFINKSGLLPADAQITDFGSKGMFVARSGVQIPIQELGSGHISALIIVFFVIVSILQKWPSVDVDKILKNDHGKMVISVPGVVLIDEIDAHLHPTWQTRIGQWFTTYFPNLQFIVTTHSPLICRAAETGTIWRLAAPGSDEQSGEVTGTARDRLLYGNVLDAYGTEVFGENVARSLKAQELLEELTRLEKLRLFGQISDEEQKRWQFLQQIFLTDAANPF